jgi:hypothetical protein
MDDLRKGKSYYLNVNGKKKLDGLMTATVSALTKPREFVAVTATAYFPGN